VKKEKSFAPLVVVVIARRQPRVDACLVVLGVFALKPEMPIFGEKILERLKFGADFE
jgi:hypothetical protein